MKKIHNAFVIGLSALLVAASGCGAHAPASSDTGSSEIGGTPSVPQTASSSPASAPGTGSGAADPESSGDSSGDSAAPSQAQQATPDQIRAALNTKVPAVLPAGVPVEEGRYWTATTASQTASYRVNFYETAQPAKINSQAAAKGTPIATVEGTEYRDAAGAKDSISGYEQVDFSNYGTLVDLGHKIKAVGDAGLGHQYLIWNEGRWCLRIDSPIDPAFRNKKYPDGEQLAKAVVAYLEDHMLPAPQKIGVISISIWNQNDGTNVEWQEDRTVYRVASKDPMTALKTAVAMKLK